MKKLIATLIFVLATSLSFAGPQVYLEQDLFDLGTLAEGNVYSKSFNIKNTGDADLKVDFIRVSCGCVKITHPTKEVMLSPGDKLKIDYDFDTTGFVGEVEKHIYISTSDPQKSLISVKLTTNVEPERQVLLGRFDKFSGWTVIGAGLVDGINPCAFTVLVFFISFLSFVGYKRKQIVILGSVFILSVFLTYLLIGLGIFEFLRRLAIFYTLSRFIYFFTACLAIILGIFSLRDWWVFKKTKDPEKMKLKLPGMIKRQIQDVIREKTDYRDKLNQPRGIIKLILTALSCGFIVSVLESVCTGQLYVPTIVYVLGIPELRIKAWAYLIIYNLMFVLPLLAIFMFALWGVTSEGFAKIARLHLAKVKFITALVFLCLGLFLLFMVRH